MIMPNKNQVVVLGHNSDRSISAETLEKIKIKLKQLTEHLNIADKEHRASHGDDFYFADEVNEKQSCDALGKTVFGVHRRPNPYEKKAFARDAENSINKAWGLSHDLRHIINSIGGGLDD